MFSLDAAMKVLLPFYQNPLRGYYLREISRKSSFSYERVHKWANELENGGVLVSERRGKIKEYRLNKSNDVVAKIFALHDFDKRNSFFEKNKPMKESVCGLKDMLVERVSEPIESILLSAKKTGGRGAEINIQILANQALGIQAYSEIEKICKECSKEFNFLIYVDTVQQFRTKWFEDKDYRKMWFEGILLHGEETFWHEFFKIEKKMETNLFQ